MILKRYKSLNVSAIYLYGSFLHGRSTSSSDIDLVVILKKNGVERREVIRSNREFHHTIISLNILKEDSASSFNGHLYINKFLGPGIFLYSAGKIKQELSHIFSSFLDNYVIKDLKKKEVSLNNIIAQAYLKHLDLFPHYIVPLSRWMCGPRGNELLEAIKNKFREALKFSKKVNLIGEDIYSLKIHGDRDYLAKIKDEILVMRWWKINQNNHKDDPKFILNHLNKLYVKAENFKGEIARALMLLEELVNE